MGLQRGLRLRARGRCGQEAATVRARSAAPNTTHLLGKYPRRPMRPIEFHFCPSEEEEVGGNSGKCWPHRPQWPPLVAGRCDRLAADAAESIVQGAGALASTPGLAGSPYRMRRRMSGKLQKAAAGGSRPRPPGGPARSRALVHQRRERLTQLLHDYGDRRVVLELAGQAFPDVSERTLEADVALIVASWQAELQRATPELAAEARADILADLRSARAAGNWAAVAALHRVRAQIEGTAAERHHVQVEPLARVVSPTAEAIAKKLAELADRPDRTTPAIIHEVILGGQPSGLHPDDDQEEDEP
jgi:hypothetical protein